jgi:hypothetical protein
MSEMRISNPVFFFWLPKVLRVSAMLGTVWMRMQCACLPCACGCRASQDATSRALLQALLQALLKALRKALRKALLGNCTDFALPVLGLVVFCAVFFGEGGVAELPRKGPAKKK